MDNWWDSDPDADAGTPLSPYAGAIASIESAGSGDYRAVGPRTRTGDRALGRYQVMSQNIGPWSREVLGREVSPQEFIANPQLQDAIFEGKFGQYVQKYGPEGAARAWFAGEGGMNNPNARDQLGTSVAQYAAKFNRGLDQQPQAMAFAPQEAVPQFPPQSAQAPATGNWWDSDPDADAASQEGGRVNTVTVRPAGQTPLVAAPQTAEQPPVSMTEAGARGVAQGATFNFYDELRGLIEASGANPRDPASLGKLLQGAYKYWSGDKQAEKTYEATKAREDALTKKAETDQPGASLAGNIAGAIAMPLGAMAGAATLPARIGRGAAVGAATGAAAGAGEGEGALDRTVRGVSGASLGAGVGAALPVGVEGVVRGARAVATPVANAIRGVRNPQDEAARRVALSLQRDIEIDPTAAGRLTPQEFAASRAAGEPVTFMDIGGETTRALGRSAANTSPEGRATLTKVIDDRFEGQTPRVTEWLGKNFNYPDAGALEEAIDQAAKSVNRQTYAKAYAKGQGIWDEDLSQLAQAPVMQQAIRLASVTGRNRDTLAGFPAVKNPFSMNKETGMFELAPGVTPNLQFWDHVKRNLDGLGAEGQAFSKALRGHLDQLVPEYKAARAGAAAFFGAEDALDAGKKFALSRNIDNRDAARELAKMKPHERGLFQDGFISEFTRTLSQTGDRRTILNKIAESPAARQRLEMVLGPQKAKELEAMLRVEGIMDMARPAIQGNSTTARQLAELGLAGGTYTVGTGGNVFSPDATAIANAALVYGAARGRNKINENVSRKVAEMLASSDPKILLRGIKIVAKNQQLFNSLRATDKGLARIGGQQSSGFAPVQAGAVSRAEEEQPSVPRPPGQ